MPSSDDDSRTALVPVAKGQLCIVAWDVRAEGAFPQRYDLLEDFAASMHGSGYESGVENLIGVLGLRLR